MTMYTNHHSHFSSLDKRSRATEDLSRAPHCNWCGDPLYNLSKAKSKNGKLFISYSFQNVRIVYHCQLNALVCILDGWSDKTSNLKMLYWTGHLC